MAHTDNGLHWARVDLFDPHWYAQTYSTETDWLGRKEVTGIYYVDMAPRGYLATYSSASGVRVGKFDTLDEAMAACGHDAMCIRAGGYMDTSLIEIMH